MTSLRLVFASFALAVTLAGCKTADEGSSKCPHMAKKNADGTKAATPDEPAPPPPDTSACDGKPLEVITDRWPNGNLKLEQQIVRDEDGNAIPNGVRTTYWEEGGKKVELRYVCGVLHGLKRAWHRDGSKWQEGHYYNGKENGLWTEWLANGNKIREFSMRYGAWNGVFTEWHINGQIKTQVEWIDGKKQGTQTWWDEDGNVFKRVEYVDGVEQPGVTP